MNRLKPDEWVDIVDSITVIWPRSRWSTPQPREGETVISRAQVLFEHFQEIPGSAIRRALSEWLDAGKGRAPKVDELRAMALRMAARPEIPADADPTDPTWCDHRWEIVSEEAGYRNAQCIRCGVERTFLSRLLPTAGELADIKKGIAATQLEVVDEEDQVEVWV